jgi:hypothetical protein
MAKIRTLKFYRGKKANLPVLGEGEPGYCTDEKELYVGSASDGNIFVGGATRMPPAIKTVTIPASAWTAASPSTATVACEGIYVDMPQELFDVDCLLSAQKPIIASAGLGNTDIVPGNGMIKLTCVGVVPTVDLKIVVTIYG